MGMKPVRLDGTLGGLTFAAGAPAEIGLPPNTTEACREIGSWHALALTPQGCLARGSRCTCLAGDGSGRLQGSGVSLGQCLLGSGAWGEFVVAVSVRARMHLVLGRDSADGHGWSSEAYWPPTRGHRGGRGACTVSAHDGPQISDFGQHARRSDHHGNRCQPKDADGGVPASWRVRFTVWGNGTPTQP